MVPPTPQEDRPGRESSPDRLDVVSPVVVARLEERLSELALDDERDRRSRIERADEVRRATRARIIDLFGAERYGSWRRFVAQQRVARLRLGSPPYDGEAIEERRRERTAASRAEGDELLREWGVDAESVRVVAAEAAERIMSALHPAHAVADEGLVLRPNPLTPLEGEDDGGLVTNLAVPPYGGEGGSSAPADGGPFTVTATSDTDAETGLLGHSLRVENYDAGDNDFITATDHEFIRHGIFMPEAGRLSVSIHLTTQRTGHRLKIEDEFGTSQSDVIQRNDITFRAVGDAGESSQAKQQMMRYRSVRNAFFVNFFDAFPEGTTFELGYVTDRTFGEGEFVLLEIGSLSTNEVFTNDMEIDSRMRYRYRVDHVVTDVLHF